MIRAPTLSIVVSLVVAACTVGPAYQRPSAPQPNVAAYKEAGRNGPWRIANPSDAMLRGPWWKVFHEPELDALEDQLQLDNQTIAQYFANYMVARAEIREARAGYFPTVSAAPSVIAGRSSGALGGVAATTGTTGMTPPTTTAGGGSTGASYTEYSLPLEASWAPDLFGRVRNAVRAAQANAQVSAADLEGERLLEQATLAQTYFELRGQEALQDLLDKSATADAEILAVAKSRFETGVDTELAAVQAEQTWETAVAAATNAGVLRAQYEHAIAQLVGKPATTFSIPHRGTLGAPPAVPVGTPSRLLERRPDVAAAERQMAAANAQIGIGYAAYYPDLTLTGTIGLASTALGTLISWPARVWSVGATATETLFDGGLRRAQLDQYIAAYNGTVAGYRQAVLNAFQQVEDGLSGTSILALEVQQQQRDVELAERAFTLEQSRYQQGIDPYINLEQQQTVLLTARQALITVQVQDMTSAVALIEALGGGWEVTDLPTAEDATKRAPDIQMTK